MEPLEYLSPFLEVINSPETSGPITAVALGSVNKFLDCELLGAQYAVLCWPSCRPNELLLFLGLICAAAGSAVSLLHKD